MPLRLAVLVPVGALCALADTGRLSLYPPLLALPRSLAIESLFDPLLHALVRHPAELTAVVRRQGQIMRERDGRDHQIIAADHLPLLLASMKCFMTMRGEGPGGGSSGSANVTSAQLPVRRSK